MLKFIKTKKRLALAATLVVVAGGAIGAYAYFTAGGAGSGTALTGHATALVIKQVGAGYDSLIPSDSYIQDQSFAAPGITQFGNQVNLATPGYQRLVNVVVAFRNHDAAFSGVPITLTIDGSHSAMATPSFAGAVDGHSTVTNVTFDFSDQNVFVTSPVLYDISFDSSAPAGGLNPALSNSDYDVSVGSDTVAHTVWVAGTPLGLDGDFPPCTLGGTTTFSPVLTNCGDPDLGNPGAYGTDPEVASGNADIPAVELNVVGGVVGPLSPAGPAFPVEFAVTNPGPTTAVINTVTTAFGSPVFNGNTQSDVGHEACSQGFYTITGSATFPADTNVGPGQTIFSPPSGSNTTSISMSDDGANQNNCEDLTLNLAFTSSSS